MVRTQFLPSGPSVRSSDWSTLTICAMLHMYSLSACRLKMFSPSPAATALRIVACCHSRPLRCSSLCGMRSHTPHSSRIRPDLPVGIVCIQQVRAAGSCPASTRGKMLNCVYMPSGVNCWGGWMPFS